MSTDNITFIKGQTYWLENPKHGTLRAKLELVSGNGLSLAFVLEQRIAIHADGGFFVTDGLALLQENGVFSDIFTNERWTIYDTEPANKLPTK